MINERKFSNKREFINYYTNLEDIISKEELILDLCKNKKVLDLGCIDHSFQTAQDLGDEWLHKRIANVSNKTTGLDILEKDAIQLNKIGFDIEIANVESFDLNKTFDVIVAADLIEHLSNVGLFLNCVKKHMNKNSYFIITTPNPFNIEQIMLAIFHNIIIVNDEHTMWIDPRVMWETINRGGLSIIDFHWVDTRFHFPVRYKKKLLGIKFNFSKIINYFSKYIMEKRAICRRDYAIIIKRNITED